MRSSNVRRKKYKAKVSGEVSKDRIEKYGAVQKALFKSAVIDQTRIEREVKALAEGYNIPSMLMHFYTNFGKKVCQLKNKFKGTNLYNELDILDDVWAARGMNTTLMTDIKTYYVPGYAVPVPPPVWGWNTEHATDANCLLLYHCEDNVATTVVIDSSGNVWDGTANTNTNIMSAAGRFNLGFHTDDIYHVNNTILALRQALQAAMGIAITCEIWCKHDLTDWSLSGGQTWYTITVSGANQHQVHFMAGTNTLRFYHTAGGIMVSVSVVGEPPVDTDTWHHYATTVDVAADEFKAWVDGVQVGLTQSGLGVWAGTPANCVVNCDWGFVGERFDGTCDEFAASNIVRY